MDNGIFGWVFDKKLDPGAHLEQGDLVSFSEEKNELRKLGIVVTADCDLENKKHGQLITLVPVLTVKAILENYLLLEACEGLREQIFKFVCKKFDIDISDGVGIAVPEIMAKLDVVAADDSIEKIAAKFALHRLDKIDYRSYKELVTAIGSSPKGAKGFEGQLAKKGDLLLLPSLIKIGFAADVAWVRHIWQVPVRDVAIKTSALNLAPGEKIARLDSPFRYRLTQKLGQVFSDIGLPDVEKNFEVEIEKVFQ